MEKFSIEDFDDKIDSLYRLVIVAARRASHLAKPDSRPFVARTSRKPTMVALEEVLEDKVTYKTGETDEGNYVE